MLCGQKGLKIDRKPEDVQTRGKSSLFSSINCEHGWEVKDSFCGEPDKEGSVESEDGRAGQTGLDIPCSATFENKWGPAAAGGVVFLNGYQGPVLPLPKP